MRTFLVSSVVLIFLAVASIAGTFLAMRHLNMFEIIESQYAGECVPVVGVPGVEDLAADESLERVWLSSMDRRDESDSVRGAIIAFDPENPLDTASWRDRTGGIPTVFEPLGIDLYKDEGVHRLFVVNAADPAVLIYDVSETGQLDLIQTVRDPRLTTPNSVVAVGSRSFYVSNASQGAGKGVLAELGFLFGNAGGSILFYDGSSLSNAATELKFANGLEISADGSQLYVAETSGKAITIYDRNLSSGVIVKSRGLLLDGFPDNINRLEDGALLVSSIPAPRAFAKHRADAEHVAPSRILRLETPIDETGIPEAVFQDDGNSLSGATSAIRLGQKLLIGAYAENKFLLCN
ncbi:MAG: SMP-30/gluconolactonase/LRE family protein [Aquisalinus sp.]|nr:SMP-30/gluconolactonase/LRE family protein [Aquisalinus sp.]